MAAWELLAPRRALAAGRAPRWPSNLGIVVVDVIAVRSSFRRRRWARRFCRRARMGAVPSRRSAARRRRAPRLSRPRSRHLRPARRVPQCAVAVAVAPHAPRRSRHRRDHRLALSPVRDLHFPGIKIAVVLAFGIPPVAVFLFEVVLNATSLFNHCQRVDAGVARPRRAAPGRDARHAPRASFDRARGDRQQFRLQSAVVGSAVRHLSARPRPATTA